MRQDDAGPSTTLIQDSQTSLSLHFSSLVTGILVRTPYRLVRPLQQNVTTVMHALAVDHVMTGVHHQSQSICASDTLSRQHGLALTQGPTTHLYHTSSAFTSCSLCSSVIGLFVDYRRPTITVQYHGSCWRNISHVVLLQMDAGVDVAVMAPSGNTPLHCEAPQCSTPFLHL